MTVQLTPYLGFRDQARAALEFYHSVFGGQLAVNTYADFPGSDPADADKLMHGQLNTPNGLVIMASDAPTAMAADEGSSISVMVSGDEADVLTGYWNGLADGATITQPLEASPWGDTFGMLTDRFGTTWFVNISARPS